MTATAGRLRHRSGRLCAWTCWLTVWLAPGSGAAVEPPVLAGPAMGTTYRVTLAREVPGMTRGTVHREIEAVLARIDRGLSTWREDSDASRFNRAAAGEWVEVSSDLVDVVAIARRVHDDTDGAFDVTVNANHPGSGTGMDLVETRSAPPALRKTRPHVRLDLGGIGPGYAVDAIGARLGEIGSTDHLVELGGEVRAWGFAAGGGPWRVALRHVGTVVELAPGEAVATSTVRPGRSPVDPRTGRAVASALRCATVRARSCAEADARAVAKLVLVSRAGGPSGAAAGSRGDTGGSPDR